MWPMSATALAVPEMIRRGWQKRQWRIARARENLADFGPLVVKDNEGGLIEYDALHLQWIWHVTYCWNRNLHAGIWAPWGHGKTMGLVVPMAAWLIGRNPQIRTKVVCAADGPASERLQAVRTVIDSPEFRDVFPNIKQGAKWTEHRLLVDRVGNAPDATLAAHGSVSKVTGTRAEVILFDDVVDLENAENEVQRAKIKKQVHTKWMSRLDPRQGHALWICTPYHVDDASHELLERDGWCTLQQPVHPDLDHHETCVVGAGPDYLEAVAGMQADYDRAQQELEAL
jgi:hypothetical protein